LISSGLNTIYKFETKLSKYEIIYSFYNLSIENYLKIMNNEIDTLYTDTAHINNLYGSTQKILDFLCLNN